MSIHFVPLSVEHLRQVWSIEQQAHSHPWSQSMINDLASRGACHRAMLLNDQLLGYYYAQHVIGEITLLNLAIAPSEQGKGYGKQLIEDFIQQGERLQAQSAWLEVRASNQRAFQLYQDAGFNEIDRRFNYYPTEHGKEDAIIMSYFFL
ncbi:ribosomal protein S18-alanine N-acetyltransferase [Vibrio metschnikovii]|nr:ribosomal protein S18-alanine N-acetyltransferase [Vibrio metschnikovii]